MALTFLVAANNLGDRVALGVLAEPIKLEFGVSDTLIGLLSGTAFALVYPPLGLPIAYLADRKSRKIILSVCLAVWSAGTTLCGFAAAFWHLFLARGLVAAGEAGYVPTTHALIADYVSSKWRATAFAVLVVGGAFGVLTATVLGAMVADVWGWRITFLALGIPGLATALLYALLIREPPRIAAESPSDAGVWDCYRRLLRQRAYLWCIIGSSFHLMVSYGMSAWTAPHLMRALDFTIVEAGLVVGVAGMLAGLIGGLGGGIIGDRLAASDARWRALWPAITVLVTGPLAVFAYLVADAALAVSLICAAAVFGSFYQTSTYALVQEVASDAERSSAAALMIFVQNVVGLGLGPVVIGVLSDALGATSGVWSLGIALALIQALNIISAICFLRSASGFKSPRAPV